MSFNSTSVESSDDLSFLDAYNAHKSRSFEPEEDDFSFSPPPLASQGESTPRLIGGTGLSPIEYEQAPCVDSLIMSDFDLSEINSIFGRDGADQGRILESMLAFEGESDRARVEKDFSWFEFDHETLSELDLDSLELPPSANFYGGDDMDDLLNTLLRGDQMMTSPNLPLTHTDSDVSGSTETGNPLPRSSVKRARDSFTASEQSEEQPCPPLAKRPRRLVLTMKKTNVTFTNVEWSDQEALEVPPTPSASTALQKKVPTQQKIAEANAWLAHVEARGTYATNYLAFLKERRARGLPVRFPCVEGIGAASGKREVEGELRKKLRLDVQQKLTAMHKTLQAMYEGTYTELRREANRAQLQFERLYAAVVNFNKFHAQGA